MRCFTRCSACFLACALTGSLAAAQQTTPPVEDSTTRPAATLQRVTVRESARRTRSYATPRTSSATRTSTVLRDIPQAATVVGQALIADQVMTGMADVVRYMPGITMGLGEGHRDAPTIRGQASTADFFTDGIRDDAQYYRDTYNVERVEALKGPNAMTFGRGGGGGVLNRVSKDAQWTPIRAGTMTGGSFDQHRATLDVGQAVSRHLAARVNALYEGGHGFRQANDVGRIGINPTASLMLRNTLVKLGYEFYRDRRVVDRGIPSFQGAPAPANYRNFFGDPAQSTSRLDAHALSATVERQLWQGNAHSDGVQLRNRSRLQQYDKFYRNVFPGAVNAAATSVNLSGYDNGTDRTNLFNQTDLTTTVTTGHVRQTLLAGAELGRQTTDNRRNTAYFGASGSTVTSIAVPFAAPLVSTPVEFRFSATDADNRTVLTTQAAYAQNQLELGRHLQAIVGIRYDRLDMQFTNKRTGQQLARVDNLVSPRAGLVIKPAQPVSIYSSYSVSYLPSSGDQFAALTATTQTLKPEQFTNREIGVKWDANAELSLTAAVYRLDRTNTTAPDPNNAALIVQTGAQRTNGWELGVTGAPTARWQIAGGYANQTARITSRTAAAREGASVALVPRHTLSLWNKVQIARPLAAGLGVVHQDRMFAAIDNAVTLPSFTRVDAGLFVNVTRALRAQLNVENLLDRRYISTAHNNNNLMPGAPRTYRLTLNAAY